MRITVGIDDRGLSIRAEKLDEAFAGFCDRLAVAPEYLPLFRRIASDAWRNYIAAAREQVMTIQRRLHSSRERRQRVIDFYLDGKLTSDVYEEQLRRMDAEVRADEAQLLAVQSDAVDAEAAIDFALELVRVPGERWRNATLSVKQRFQQVFRNACGLRTANFEPVKLAFFSSSSGQKVVRILGW